MSSLDEYKRRAVALVAELDRIPDRSLADPDVKRRIAQLVEESVARLSRGESIAMDATSGRSIARMLTDAYGPDEPDHPVYGALRRFDELRKAIVLQTPVQAQMLPRQSLAGLATSSDSVLSSWWQDFRAFGVHLPVLTDGETDAVRVPQVVAQGGSAFVPVFTDEDASGRWASGLGSTGRVAFRLVRLLDAAGIADRGGVGIAINPLDENVALTGPFVSAQVSPQVLPAGTELNLGRPASLPDGLEPALQQWARNDPAISEVSLAQAITRDGRQGLLAVVRRVPPLTPDRMGRALHAVLPAGVGVDLVPADSDLGRAVAEAGTRIFMRS